jgi:RNA polymerase primary sigma factor
MTENGTQQPIARRRPAKQAYCHEAQMQLVRQAQAGCQQAMSTLIEDNQGLIWKQVLRAAPHARHMADDDLFQEGACGFLKAVERFDTNSGNRLSTYATWWIRQAVRRAIQCQDDLIRLPAHVYEQMQRGKRTRQPHEYAPMSLDAPMGDAPNANSLGDLLAAPDQVTIGDPRLAPVLAAIQQLPEQQRQAIELMYLNEYPTLRAAGEQMGMSGERVRQLVKMGLATVRAACGE